MGDFIMAICTAIRTVSQKQPLRPPMASEVAFDLGNELRDLDNPRSSAFLVPKCFFEPFIPRMEGQRRNVMVSICFLILNMFALSSFSI